MPDDWPQTPLPRPQPPDEVRGVVERLPDGVPDGRVPMGATVAGIGAGLEPGVRSRGGDAPVGLELVVRLWAPPKALSKALLVGPAVWGLAVLWGRGLGLAAAPSLAEAGVPTSAPDGARPTASNVRGEGPRRLAGPLATGAPGRMLPVSST